MMLVICKRAKASMVRQKIVNYVNKMVPKGRRNGVLLGNYRSLASNFYSANVANSGHLQPFHLAVNQRAARLHGTF